MLFKNRQDAGRQLAEKVAALHLKEALVLGLPRGGVVVAAEVSNALGFPLDIVVPRKIGAPMNPELAIGALVEDVVLLDEEIMRQLGGVNEDYLRSEIEQQQQEAKRRMGLYRTGKPPLDVRGKTVVVVDDGIATGATMRASLRYLKRQGAKRRIGAVPVAPQDTVERMKREGEEIVALFTPAVFYAVGQFYADFPQTEDSEVIAILGRS
jgi:putative phosphoribosyl transferase